MRTNVAFKKEVGVGDVVSWYSENYGQRRGTIVKLTEQLVHSWNYVNRVWSKKPQGTQVTLTVEVDFEAEGEKLYRSARIVTLYKLHRVVKIDQEAMNVAV